jgi:enamine deaminase RidA (YjgF/YER057c/UK114 family)
MSSFTSTRALIMIASPYQHHNMHGFQSPRIIVYTIFVSSHWSSAFVYPASSHSFRRPPSSAVVMSNTDDTLESLGIQLPPPPQPAANYVPCQWHGNLLYLSGHLPLKNDGSLMTGVLNTPFDTQRGYDAARQVGLNLIATLKQALDGDLDRVEQIVKLFGIVQSTSDFHEQHKVMNGCSDLMCQVFGKERGLHARSAIGTNALPLDISVEIEAIVRVRDA